MRRIIALAVLVLVALIIFAEFGPSVLFGGH